MSCSNKKLKEKLAIANRTVCLQIDENVRLNKELKETRELFMTVFAESEANKTISKSTERHIKIAENEIKRLHVIINYLETRNMERHDD